jgi:hypothetical protein
MAEQRAVEHHEVTAPRPAAQTPLVGMTQGISTTYQTTPRRTPLASTVGVRIRSYVFDASAYTADSNGDKYVQRGTVLTYSSSVYNGCKPRTDDDVAIGILNMAINARDGNVAVPMIVAGAVREDLCWDDEAFGSVAASVKTDLPFIQFTDYDI